MRIVGGKFKGRDLTSPGEFRVRPTAENVRGAMLDMLAPHLEKARVLDLFAGSGALGLEAMSRGASRADFVEWHPPALHSLKANIATLRLLRMTRVFTKDAVPFAAALSPDTYDIAFADPPYGSKMLDMVIERWHSNHFSRILAVEHASTHRVPAGAKRKVFDETAVTIYERKGGTAGADIQLRSG